MHQYIHADINDDINHYTHLFKCNDMIYSSYIYIYTHGMYTVYWSVDAHKSIQKNPLTSYHHLLYWSPDSQHKISRRSGSAAGKCWGRFSQSSEKNCLSSRALGPPYSFSPKIGGSSRISRQWTEKTSKWTAEFLLIHYIELNNEYQIETLKKLMDDPFWPGISTDSGAIKLRKSSDCAGDIQTAAFVSHW